MVDDVSLLYLYVVIGIICFSFHSWTLHFARRICHSARAVWPLCVTDARCSCVRFAVWMSSTQLLKLQTTRRWSIEDTTGTSLFYHDHCSQWLTICLQHTTGNLWHVRTVWTATWTSSLRSWRSTSPTTTSTTRGWASPLLLPLQREWRWLAISWNNKEEKAGLFKECFTHTTRDIDWERCHVTVWCVRTFILIETIQATSKSVVFL